MNKELKPCPLCGCKEIQIHYGSVYRAACNNCGFTLGDYSSYLEIIYAWVKRAEKEAVNE